MLDFSFRRIAPQDFAFCWFRQAKIPSATAAQLDALAFHHRGDHPDGHAHVATAANLVAHQGNSLLAARAQTVVMAQNRRGDGGAQFGGLGFVFLGFVAKFNSL